jgi:predicted nucleic acid-binding protein
MAINREIVVDANVFLAVILNEPERERIIEITKGLEFISPEIMPYEVANALSAMLKRNRLNIEQVLRSFDIFNMIPFRPVKVDIPKALELAGRFKSYAYDAYYLEIAQSLGIPLLTMDKQMKNNGLDLKLIILEV